jgi:hypothetical protein
MLTGLVVLAEDLDLFMLSVDTNEESSLLQHRCENLKSRLLLLGGGEMRMPPPSNQSFVKKKTLIRRSSRD